MEMMMMGRSVDGWIDGWIDGWMDPWMDRQGKEEEEAVSSCLEFPASILHIKKYFRQNKRNKWHNIKIIFIEIIVSKMDF